MADMKIALTMMTTERITPTHIAYIRSYIEITLE